MFFNKYFFSLLIIFLLPIQFGLGLFIYLSHDLPSTADVRKVELQIPLKIFTSDGKLIGEYGEIHRTKLSFDQIPENIVNAFLAAEDSDFFSHSGVDFLSLIRATYQFVKEGEIVSGGGTITMQVARNYVLTKEQTFERKLKEIFMAFKLDLSFTKEEIFELYVNQIFLGNRAYGIAAASEIYYGEDLADLSVAQSAMIASLPKAPSRINPIANPERSLIRRNWVLSRMESLGFIEEKVFEEAFNEPISASFYGIGSEVEADYLSEQIRRYMIENYGLSSYKEGYKVYSTISSSKQSAAVNSLRRGIEEYESRHGFRKPNNFKELIPKEFNQRSDLFYKVGYDPSNFRDSFGLKKDLLNPLDDLLDFLSDQPRFNSFEPVLILSVDSSKISLLKKNSEIETIYLNNLSSNIRPRIDENKKGKNMTSFSSFFETGDLIWFKETSEKKFELAMHPEVQSALVSIDPNSGKILALVGGYNFNSSKFNRAFQAKPQLGSNFKPFLYAAAFENGYSPATIINDAPIVFEDQNLEEFWRPKNASGKFYGPTRLREALLQSRNVVSVRLLNDLGISKAKNYLTRFGFERDSLPEDLSMALGSYGISPYKNAEFFSIFANGGKKIEPFYIERIIDKNGKELILENEDVSKASIAKWYGKQIPKEETFAIDPRVSFLVNDILREATQRGTGKAIKKLERDDFAGKTGTTNDSESTWFTGFNNKILTTVWFGYDQPRSLGTNEYGSTTALPIWLNFMEEIIDSIEYSIPVVPSNLIAKKINLSTGKEANSLDDNARFEYFFD
tara:strand:+ start:459 stop:2834 length:2376 start_codon:yes stop_codon:yes gene_type:complete